RLTHDRVEERRLADVRSAGQDDPAASLPGHDRTAATRFGRSEDARLAELWSGRGAWSKEAGRPIDLAHSPIEPDSACRSRDDHANLLRSSRWRPRAI